MDIREGPKPTRLEPPLLSYSDGSSPTLTRLKLTIHGPLVVAEYGGVYEADGSTIVTGWDPNYWSAGSSQKWRGFTDDPARLGKYSAISQDSTRI